MLVYGDNKKVFVGTGTSNSFRDFRSYSALYWQQISFGSVVPENIPKVHKKNRHSHSLGHKLRRYNLVAWAKRFT